MEIDLYQDCVKSVRCGIGLDYSVAVIKINNFDLYENQRENIFSWIKWIAFFLPPLQLLLDTLNL